MIPKIKKFIKKNSKLVKLIIIVLLVLILFLVLYKVLFYSTNEKAVYGVRLRDIKENEFISSEKKEVKENSSNIEGISSVDIKVKGRLIKLFVTFKDDVNTAEIKTKFNEMLGFFSEKVKKYYDITFYAIQDKDEKESYPVIGYKHKSKDTITFDEL